MERFVGICKGKDLKKAMTKAALEASLGEKRNTVNLQARFNSKTGEGFTDIEGDARGAKAAMLILIDELAKETGITTSNLLFQFLQMNELSEKWEEKARTKND